MKFELGHYNPELVSAINEQLDREGIAFNPDVSSIHEEDNKVCVVLNAAWDEAPSVGANAIGETVFEIRSVKPDGSVYLYTDKENLV
jgi:hypothetical protein